MQNDRQTGQGDLFKALGVAGSSYGIATEFHLRFLHFVSVPKIQGTTNYHTLVVILVLPEVRSTVCSRIIVQVISMSS